MLMATYPVQALTHATQTLTNILLHLIQRGYSRQACFEKLSIMQNKSDLLHDHLAAYYHQ